MEELFSYSQTLVVTKPEPMFENSEYNNYMIFACHAPRNMVIM